MTIKNEKVLILGGDGMLGHKAFQEFAKSFETYATFRTFSMSLRKENIFPSDKVIDNVNAFDFKALENVIRELNPKTIINCIGIVKQRKEAHDKRMSIYVNSLFPHLLQEICAKTGARLMHVSTDCVFSGKKGNYDETDVPDAEDIYGRTKYLGELEEAPSLTVRTSIIGHGLFRNASLVDWFLCQDHGRIKGYVNALYTGLPTITFCRELVRVTKDHPELSGLFHFGANVISKYELLLLIREIYGLSVVIEPSEDYCCDRSMNSNRYRQAARYEVPSWRLMIEDMHSDYEEHRYYGRLNETER